MARPRSAVALTALGAAAYLGGASWWYRQAQRRVATPRRGLEPDLRRWSWLPELLPLRLRRYLLVTAGPAVVGPELRPLCGRARGLLVDLAGAAIPDYLPGPRGRLDLVLVVFASHRLRNKADREALCAQARRLLTPQGRLVLIEHHRSAATVLAFGPAARHCYPLREWERAAAAGGLQVVAARRVSPLLTGLAMTAQPAPGTGYPGSGGGCGTPGAGRRFPA